MVSIPEAMTAAVVVKHGAPVEIKTTPVPEVGRGQVLIKITNSGVCHTDAHVADNEWNAPLPLPLIPGHEGVGTVVKVGEGVDDVKLGDRVGMFWMHKSCGHCFDCRDGWENVCEKSVSSGFSTNGTLAQYAVAFADYVARIPDGLTDEQAAPILCAGITVYKALKTSNVKPGAWVSVTGAAGGLGHVAVQYAKAMGMNVIAITRSLSAVKKAMFEKFAVDYVVDLSKETVVDGVMKATRGDGVDGAICVAPSLQDFTDAIDYLAPRGTIVTVAVPDGSFKVNPMKLVLKAANYVGSPLGNRNELAEALAFAAAGKVKCHVTMKKLEEVNEIFDDLRKGRVQGRVVVTMP